MNTTTATPTEIDAELARINGEIARHEAVVARADSSLERLAQGRGGVYETVEEIEARRDAALDAIGELSTETLPLHAEYDRRPWTRWFLVEGGHLHYDVSSHRCSRILSTSHYWLTELSGQAEAEVIELAGERVCTTCFPAAPVAALTRTSKLFTKTEQEKEDARIARAEKKREADAKKIAKAITNPDGTPLVLGTGRWTDKIETETAAKIKVVDELWYEKFYGADAERQANIELLLAALAAKHETTVEDERAAAEKRLAARIKREG